MGSVKRKAPGQNSETKEKKKSALDEIMQVPFLSSHGYICIPQNPFGMLSILSQHTNKLAILLECVVNFTLILHERTFCVGWDGRVIPSATSLQHEALFRLCLCWFQMEEQKKKSVRADYWLYPGIVVKVVTKKLGEKYHKKKGVIKVRFFAKICVRTHILYFKKPDYHGSSVNPDL